MKWRNSVVVTVVVLALSACGTDPSSTKDAAATTGPATSNSQIQSVAKIDDFIATTVSGQTFVLSEALSQKPVVLWFWAPG